MSNSVYKFVNGRCPQHDQDVIIRVTFTETENPVLGVYYEKESYLCALADNKGCINQDQCPIYAYAQVETVQ